MGDEQCADHVAYVNEEPVSQHGPPGQPASGDAHEHQCIACKELPSGNQDEHQPGGEDGSGKCLSDPISVRGCQKIEGSHI